MLVKINGWVKKIFKGGGDEENFERKMFVDTSIKACTHKN